MAELLRDREAVAHGLSVMAVDMLFHELPRMLEEIVGRRQAAVLLERLASRAAEKGFREFAAKAGVTGPLEPLHLLTIFLRPPSGEKLHPFQVASRLETGGAGARLVLAEQLGPLEAALLAGVVAGVLTAAGHPARAVGSSDAAGRACGSVEGLEFVVYADDASAVVVEPCGRS